MRSTQVLDDLSLTAHVSGDPLSSLADLLLVDVGLSLAYPPELASRPVHVAWSSRPALPALQALASSLGLVAVVRGPRHVELSVERASDAEVFAISPVYDSPDEVSRYVSRLLSTVGAADVVGRQVYITDIPDRAHRLEAFTTLLNAPRSQWLVEARFIEISERFERRIGAELRAAGPLSLTFSASDLLSPIRGGALLVELLAEAYAQTSDARLLSTVRVLVVDGLAASQHLGERTPVPLRTVSDQGTVTTTRYDYIETGNLLDVTLRELPDGSALLTIRPEVSAVTGFVETAPIVTRSKLDVTAIMRSGDVLVVGGLDLSEASSGLDGFAPIAARHRASSRSRSVVVVMRAQRVSAAHAALQGGRGSSEGEGARPPQQQLASGSEIFSTHSVQPLHTDDR